jgi:hypothetical protein
MDARRPNRPGTAGARNRTQPGPETATAPNGPAVAPTERNLARQAAKPHQAKPGAGRAFRRPGTGRSPGGPRGRSAGGQPDGGQPAVAFGFSVARVSAGLAAS